MTFRYVTLKDQYLIDAIKHKNRCEWYLLLGMYNHACGSFRKYDKWMKRHNYLVVPSHILAIQKQLTESFANNVTDVILNSDLNRIDVFHRSLGKINSIWHTINKLG